MTHYLRSTPSTRKKNRRRGTGNDVYQKLDREKFKSSNRIPSYQTPRPDPSRDIPSMPMDFGPASRNSIMERALRGEESEETRKEIIRKSKCLAPGYNKGAMQYVGSEEQARDVGKK